jgi:hypothetical protein
MNPSGIFAMSVKREFAKMKGTAVTLTAGQTSHKEHQKLFRVAKIIFHTNSTRMLASSNGVIAAGIDNISPRTNIGVAQGASC